MTPTTYSVRISASGCAEGAGALMARCAPCGCPLVLSESGLMVPQCEAWDGPAPGCRRSPRAKDLEPEEEEVAS